MKNKLPRVVGDIRCACRAIVTMFTLSMLCHAAESHAGGVSVGTMTQAGDARSNGALPGKLSDATCVVKVLKDTSSSDAEARASAIKDAERMRSDITIPRSLRFELALQVEKLKAVKPNADKGVKRQAKESIGFSLADSLRKEFGPCSETDHYYASLLNKAPCEEARRKAVELLKDSSISPYLKKQSERAVGRYNMLGKKISLRIRTAEGKELNLQDGAPLPTVLVFLGPGDVFRNTKTDAKIRWIRVSFDKNSQTSKEINKESESLIIASEPTGFSSLLCRKLQARPGRTVYVFDKNGALVSFGALSELSSLVANLSK